MAPPAPDASPPASCLRPRTDLYLTCRSFRSRVADFVRYRRITHNMQERFPNATEEELEAADRICIICREHMTSAKKLCLNSRANIWL